MTPTIPNASPKRHAHESQNQNGCESNNSCGHFYEFTFVFCLQPIQAYSARPVRCRKLTAAAANMATVIRPDHQDIEVYQDIWSHHRLQTRVLRSRTRGSPRHDCNENSNCKERQGDDPAEVSLLYKGKQVDNDVVIAKKHQRER